MSPDRHVVRVVIASPGDVKKERDIAARVIEEVSRTIATDRALLLEVARWETDAYAGFHADGPQGICDEVLDIEGCGILVGIFWTRFGKPTADGQTGTEHEISKAIQMWRARGRPQTMIFFNNTPPRLIGSSERHQWAQVAEYREKLPKEGFYWEYETIEGFEREFRQSLTNYVRHSFPLKNSNPTGASTRDVSRGNSDESMAAPIAGDLENERPGDITVNIDPRLSPETVQGFLEALGKFHRACGGLGLQVSLARIHHERREDQSDAK